MATMLKTAGLCFAAWLVPIAVSFLVVVSRREPPSIGVARGLSGSSGSSS